MKMQNKLLDIFFLMITKIEHLFGCSVSIRSRATISAYLYFVLPLTSSIQTVFVCCRSAGGGEGHDGAGSVPCS